MNELELEQLMESRDLPECDRDELRMFGEFLGVRKRKEQVTPGMKAWLLGEDSAALAEADRLAEIAKRVPSDADLRLLAEKGDASTC